MLVEFDDIIVNKILGQFFFRSWNKLFLMDKYYHSYCNFYVATSFLSSAIGFDGFLTGFCAQCFLWEKTEILDWDRRWRSLGNNDVIPPLLTTSLPLVRLKGKTSLDVLFILQVLLSQVQYFFSYGECHESAALQPQWGLRTSFCCC